jgi:DNA polymerase I
MTQIHRPVGRGDRVFLVDGSSFVFRAYFQSIRQDQKYNYRADRLPVGAVRLFATKLLQFIRDGAAGIKPTHLAIIFDKSEDSFRREIPSTRSAGRPYSAISADARGRPRLWPAARRAGSL